jgi:hypothetical protein
MLDNLKHSSQCSDFAYIDEYSKATRFPFSDEESTKFSVGFKNYIDKWLHQDIWEGRDQVDALHEIANFLSKMITEYGYSVQAEYEHLMEEIEELEEAQERRAESQLDRWKENRAFDRARADTIDSMFSSLI